MSMAATCAAQSVAATQHPADLQSENRCSAPASPLRCTAKCDHCRAHAAMRELLSRGRVQQLWGAPGLWTLTGFSPCTEWYSFLC